MRKEDFTSSAAMTVRKQPSGYWAAHPNKLPPKLELTWQLQQQISEADRALSELAGVARMLPNPHLLMGPFMRKEAVLSSRIEGTQASLSDLLLFEASQGGEQKTRDVREVADYVRALDFALEQLKEFPFSLRLLRQMHEILLSDPTKTPGEFRTSQNWIGPPGCNLNDASYVPPPPSDLMDHLNDLELHFHEKGEFPPLIKYAIIHYQFESIHPFLDGNGRLGRLLIILLLSADPTLERPLLPTPLLYLSAYFERNRNAYYERLEAVSKHGDWPGWISFFLNGVTEQSRDAVSKSENLLALKKSVIDKVQAARGSSLVLQLAETLFETPVITIPAMAKRFNRTFAGVQLAMKKLMDLGVVQETAGSPSRLYVAAEIIATIDA